MNQLLEYYSELVKVAGDDQVKTHLENLVADAVQLTAAIDTVLKQARARTEPLAAPEGA